MLGEIYFFRLSLADIIPTSIENAQLINSIARGIGLHDFYQPGLWNFCEGFNDECVTRSAGPLEWLDANRPFTEASQAALAPRATSGSTQLISS